MFHFNMGPGFRPPSRSRPDEEYYERLGLHKKNNPSEKDIKKAYRKLAMKHHPDKASEENKKESESMFKKISEAYSVLSDKDKKKAYDMGGKSAVSNDGKSAGFPPHDLFAQFFGGPRGGPFQNHRRREEKRKGPSMTVPIHVSLEDLYKGITKKFDITRDRLCTACKGKGAPDNAFETCGMCNGQGKRQVRRQMRGGMSISVQICPQCQGKGKRMHPDLACKHCSGNKYKKEKKRCIVEIDAGMKDGDTIKKWGEGDERIGQLPGDIIFVVKEKEHPRFHRKENDLIMQRIIHPVAMYKGDSFVVDHLDKRIIYVENNKTTIAHNSLYVVKGEGMVIRGNTSSRGDLVVHYRVKPPDALNTRQKKLLDMMFPHYSSVEEPEHSEKKECAKYKGSIRVRNENGEDCSIQ